ncbi:MAG: subclass B1 metallo-beta-lactamase [Acidobacteriota bacterium]|nr:subclass B1 metallo-beta-lactamase [Acidobacteriota bacterium]
MRNLSWAFLGLVLSAGCVGAQNPADTDLGHDVHVRPLTEHTWLVSSVSNIESFGDVQSNAVLAVGPRESVLVDTPATNEQTALVLDWAEQQLHRPVRHLVMTHWHQDRMGGIDIALKRQVATYALGKTIELARQHGLSLPEHELRSQDHLALSGVLLETYYPGHGHTADNIVVWIGLDHVLDGGCFVKSMNARTLGNLAEINVPLWSKGVASVRRRYPGAGIVVPGHGDVGGLELLQHTAELLAQSENEKAVKSSK